MQALIVIDAQNEFSAQGQRPVPDFLPAIESIFEHGHSTPGTAYCLGAPF